MTSRQDFDKSTTSEEVVAAFSNYNAGTTILITGVSPNGLGAAMAMALASEHPAQLIFTARQIAKADEVVNVIKTNMKDPPPIMSLEMDLSSFESVREATKRLVEQKITINTLINNAGVMALPHRTLSVDGHEMHFATNFLGHWLFTNLISSNIAQGGRIVNVTSGGYMICPIRFHDIDWEGVEALPQEEQPDFAAAKSLGIGSLTSPGDYNGMLAYLHSNAASMLLSVGLTKRLQSQGISTLSAAPGVVITELQRHIGSFRNATMEYKTATQGAASLLVAALDPALQSRSGAYINDCQLTEIISSHVQDEQVANRLWAVANKMTNCNF
ncbi:unnamed protein product [Clonostachys byssicola]|uniref:Uncharacterized protein n=1 Tax=Clonostachys byssicola TaxID=160290 RepID=A0A9N9UB49_9HYPO|nr:unnamed protein product [Clonostachys byssicola]